MSSTTLNDEEVLAKLGYKQELKRAFKPAQLFGVAFSMIALVPAVASTLSLSLPNGGPAALVWGWTVCSVFGMSIACALAELSSAAPTAGGLYFWTFKYASPRWRTLLCWTTGYMNTMGLCAGMASCNWACAVQLMAAISIGSNMSFSPTNAQIYAVFAAFVVVSAMIAAIATRIIARLQSFYVCLNLFLCIAVIVALPAATPHESRNSASYVFSNFSNLSGWPSGFAFVVGFVGPFWIMAGYDGSIHISEEASHASTAVPTAIVASLGSAILLGFGINISLAFNMGTDIDSIMASPIEQPMATILFNSLGTKGTLTIWTFIVLGQFTGGADLLVSCSRQVFAFSRDGALPLSRYLYRVNPYTRTPVNCVLAVSAAELVIALLAFAGPSAVNAIFSLSIFGAYLAYAIPICCRLLGGVVFQPGPFSLGKFGVPVATTAVAWIAFAIVVVVFPSSPGPNGQTMNYTAVVGGGWLGVCLTYWYFPKYGGVHWFRGPAANIEPGSPVEIVEVTLLDEKNEKYSGE